MYEGLWETIGELTSNFEFFFIKTRLDSPKSIHCATKPIRIQLECPYDSSNETKNTNVWVFKIVIFIAQALYVSVYQYMCARPRAQMCNLFYTTVHSNTLFQSMNESVFKWIEWASDSHYTSLTCIVSIESAVLNKSFDMNDSVSHLLKQGFAGTYWRFYCHIYLSMTSLNQVLAQKHVQQNIV